MQIDELNRLLGPTEHEVGCDQCFDLLDEYVELELEDVAPKARIPGLHAHLEGCPACREEHDLLLDLAAAENR